MNKDLVAIFEYLEREKGIKRDIVVRAIEESLQAAARKSVSGSSNVTVKVHPKTGAIEVFSEKEIVEKVRIPSKQISLKEAREIDPDCEIGQFIDVAVTAKDFGRIAAQKAREIITSKLHHAEREVIYEEYRDRINELVSGTVKRFIRGNNLGIDLGKVEAIMPMRNYPKTEKYEIGDKVRALLIGVEDTETGGAQVVLSRSHPDFVKQLMMQEITELNEGVVIIEKIVRDAGYRTKLAVRSTDLKVDPVGACVGMRGNRIKNVLLELHGEKIDIIPYSEDPIELLQSVLDPIPIRKININEDEGVISIVVDDENFPTVIGKKGMNARLTGELIGQYALEVQRISEYKQQMAIQRTELALSEDPALDIELTSIEGVPHIIFEHLAAEGLKTPRALLTASPEKLASIPGISLEKAEEILEQIRKRL